MTDVKRLKNAIVIVGGDVSGASIGVLSEETDGNTFIEFGMDGEGPFLATDAGDRYYLENENHENAMLAIEQAVVVVYETNYRGDDVKEYQVRVSPDSIHAMGGP